MKFLHFVLWFGGYYWITCLVKQANGLKFFKNKAKLITILSKNSSSSQSWNMQKHNNLNRFERWVTTLYQTKKTRSGPSTMRIRRSGKKLRKISNELETKLDFSLVQLNKELILRSKKLRYKFKLRRKKLISQQLKRIITSKLMQMFYLEFYSFMLNSTQELCTYKAWMRFLRLCTMRFGKITAEQWRCTWNQTYSSVSLI